MRKCSQSHRNSIRGSTRHLDPLQTLAITIEHHQAILRAHHKANMDDCKRILNLLKIGKPVRGNPSWICSRSDMPDSSLHDCGAASTHAFFCFMAPGVCNQGLFHFDVAASKAFLVPSTMTSHSTSCILVSSSLSDSPVLHSISRTSIGSPISTSLIT
jgi:hypothetical protein